MRIKINAMVMALVLSGCASTEPQATKTELKEKLSGNSIPQELREQIDNSRAIGRLLYVYDTVSAIATDVLIENVKDPKNQRLGGYLALRGVDNTGRPDNSFLVKFFTNETSPRIVYEVRVAQNVKPEFHAYKPAVVATPAVAKLINARQLAIKSIPEHVQPMNPVLMPGSSNGKEEILIYLLAGTSKPDVAVFGKHYLAHVSGISGKLLTIEPLSKTILEVPIKAGNGEKVEALVVGHIVSDYPLETHVFTSLLVKLPIYVNTRRGTWLVDGDRISLVKDIEHEDGK